jgi:hypothetical protein
MPAVSSCYGLSMSEDKINMYCISMDLTIAKKCFKCANIYYVCVTSLSSDH